METISPASSVYFGDGIYCSTSSFERLLTDATFVDETLAIKTFIDIKAIHLLLPPRRSGKSTLVNMLEYDGFAPDWKVFDAFLQDSSS